jgi:formylglycine-generating enzyme required for sulfatase activity
MSDESTAVVRWLTPIHPTLAYRCATESGAPCAKDALQALYNPPLPPMPVYKTGREIDEWRAKLPRITPLARAAWGRILDERGDTRRGVGLRPDGLPDIEWVQIPAGEFTFGSQDESNGPVKITLPTFHIARYPVTYRQFQVFLDAPDGFERDEWWQELTPEYQKQEMVEQWFKYWNHPRENVSWYQAVAFCCWLSAKLGYEVRLPTEQEWEKAARGTDGREFPWGNDYISGYANIDETDQNNSIGSYYIRQTTAVRMYPQGASIYGVLDMSGNIWEWCLNDYEKPKNIDINGNTTRVLRGGSWYDLGHLARCAYRYGRYPSDRNPNLGLRVVCSVPMP